MTSYLPTVDEYILHSMLQHNQHQKVNIYMQLTINRIRHCNDPIGRAEIGRTIRRLSQCAVFHIPWSGIEFSTDGSFQFVDSQRDRCRLSKI